METVFEHQITKEEINKLEVIDTLTGETDRNYKEWASSDIAYADIVRLFLLRDDKKGAIEYLGKIEGDSIKATLMEDAQI